MSAWEIVFKSAPRIYKCFLKMRREGKKSRPVQRFLLCWASKWDELCANRHTDHEPVSWINWQKVHYAYIVWKGKNKVNKRGRSKATKRGKSGKIFCFLSWSRKTACLPPPQKSGKICWAWKKTKTKDARLRLYVALKQKKWNVTVFNKAVFAKCCKIFAS